MPKSPNIPLKWTVVHDRTLALVFEGRWSQDEIAEKLCSEFSGGSQRFTISTRALKAWIAHPDFKQRLEAMRADFAESIREVAFADKARRIHALNAAALIALRELEARPLLKEVRPTKDGFVTNEAFNNAAMSEFRAALGDIAAEKGERSSKVDVKATLQGNLSHDINLATDPQAAAAANTFIESLTTGGASESGGSGVSGE